MEKNNKKKGYISQVVSAYLASLIKSMLKIDVDFFSQTLILPYNLKLIKKQNF